MRPQASHNWLKFFLRVINGAELKITHADNCVRIRGAVVFLIVAAIAVKLLRY